MVAIAPVPPRIPRILCAKQTHACTHTHTYTHRMHARTHTRTHARTHASTLFKGGESTLCVLGAGNSNDLDLAAFASRFKGGVLLLDVDEVALKHGLELQADALSAVSLRPTPSNSNSNGNSDSNGNVVKIGVAEFTGVLNTFPNRPPRESSAENEMAKLKAAMDAKHLHTEFGTHNTVLSSCILSQFNIVGKIWGKSLY